MEGTVGTAVSVISPDEEYPQAERAENTAQPSVARNTSAAFSVFNLSVDLTQLGLPTKIIIESPSQIPRTATVGHNSMACRHNPVVG